MMIGESGGHHYDYTSDSMIYTILYNSPHFVVAILLMIGFFIFMFWKFPIYLKGYPSIVLCLVSLFS